MTPGKLAAYSSAIYLTAILVLIAATFALLHGHFTYPLDDAYIHLALAQQIAHGHYGINPGEASSPSSSILWPFLLVPFAGTRLQTALPLFWNILFGTISAALLGRFTALWINTKSAVRSAPAVQLLIALLLIFSANLAGLTLLGMEHGLQVLLAICVALGVAESFAGRDIPWWTILAAGLAPSVRYESLSLTLAMAIVLYGARRRRTAIALMLLSVTPLIGFALFLHHLGLPGLPQSVLVKGDIGHQNAAEKFFGVIGRNFSDFRSAPLWRLPLALLTVVFAFLTAKAKQRSQRLALAAALTVCVLQFLFGQFGWFHRYEVFAVIFVAVLAIPAASAGLISRKGLWSILAISASAYVVAFILTPFASRGIYLQQAQMHRFITDFYRGNIAINDLGMVSYQRPTGTYVLDLFGLASPEAAAHPNKEAPWMEDITTRKHTPLAMIYPQLFHVPTSWQPLGELCEHHTRGTVLGAPCVTFYSTQPDATATLRADFGRFAATVPSGDKATIF